MPLWFARLGLLKPLLPYLAIAGALFAAWWYVSGLQDKVEAQAGQISTLTLRVATEELARRKDVSGLTTLSKGLATATLDTKADAAIMERTIDASNPTPSSPALSALIAGLRASDGAKPTAPTGINR